MTSSEGSGPRGADLGGHKTEIALLRELADILGETGLTEIEFESGSTKIRVGKTPSGALPLTPAIAPVSATTPRPIEAGTLQETAGGGAAISTAPHPGAVKSPMVGTAYMAPSPGTAAFVAIGDQVAEGQTLLIIEAMKTMNEIKSPRAGKVIEIIAKDAEPVEFGEILLIIS